MDKRILLVDDDPQILKLFSKILTKGGYAVSTETSGDEAIKVLGTGGPFDLMVLDLCMPTPDGFEVLKEVRTRYPGLRTLVVSGFMGGALLAAANALGATATINKADAPRNLLEQVNRVLQH